MVVPYNIIWNWNMAILYGVVEERPFNLIWGYMMNGAYGWLAGRALS